MGSKKMKKEDLPHICFFPYMAAGHLNPTLDMASLFARHGTARCTVVATPSTASIINNRLSPSISALILPLPPHSDTGLPDGWDSPSAISCLDFSAIQKALALLKDPLTDLLRSDPPGCIVSDMFLYWTADVADELRIPRIVFHGMSFFALCVLDRLQRSPRPQDSAVDDSEPFVVTGIPDPPIRMTRAQLPAPLKVKPPQDRDDGDGGFFFNELMEKMDDADARSYGVLVNSFYELEPDYADHFRSALRRRAWLVGPLCLSRNGKLESYSNHDHAGLKWLDKQKPASVVYVCFGSLSRFGSAQLRELAAGLQSAGRPFLCVVRKDAPYEAEWSPSSCNGESELNGRIVRGWAPQVEILKHEGVGGFVTHCGWNSVLESIVAGVPMITWPLSADQSVNERLVVDVLRVGMPVGARIASSPEEYGREAVVGRGAVERAVTQLMGSGGDGDDADSMRARAKKLREMAAAAVEGGSSHADVRRFVEEIEIINNNK